MGEFGETLRKEREARGITLEAITKVTKISNRHLLALEREEFTALPGGVFNKGIVRGYARVAGLSEEEWVERYLAAYRASGAVPDEETSWTQFAENAGKGRESSQGRRPDMRLRWAGIAILLLLLAGFSWFVFDYVQQKILTDRQHPSARQTVPARLIEPSEPDYVRPRSSSLIPS